MTKRKKKSKIPRSIRKKMQEQKRVKKAILDSQEKLLQRVKEQSIDTGREFRVAPPNTEKMSQIIIDYARPLLEVAKNGEEQKKAITIAVTIWNLSLFPEESQSEYISEIEKIMRATSGKGGDLSEKDNAVFNYMMERKKVLFPEIARLVVDYEFVETPKSFHLNIVSNILKDGIRSEYE